jgi:endonuclease-3 related protein
MNDLEKLYRELLKKHGRPYGQWSLWCKRNKTEKEREEVIMGAVLTQRTNWQNVELAIENLKKAKADSLRKIYQLGAKKVAPLIKSSGYYLTKAKYLDNLAEFIIKQYNGIREMKRSPLRKLREELLKIKGIGPETADSILLYALDKPVFVIDEYTRRLVRKEKLKTAGTDSYCFLQKLFQDNLKRDFRLYQDFHALIVIDGKNK